MGAICYLSPTFANFFPVFEEIRQCIACTCYAPFFQAVCQAPAKVYLSRDFPPKKSGKFAPERKQHLLPYMEEGARPNPPPPAAAAAAKSARGKSKSIPPSLTPHSYSTLLPPFPSSSATLA